MFHLGRRSSTIAAVIIAPAAALWNIYEVNPYKHYAPMDVFWWPEGPKRDYINEVMKQYDAPMVEMAARPHICKSAKLLLWFEGPSDPPASACPWTDTRPDQCSKSCSP